MEAGKASSLTTLAPGGSFSPVGWSARAFAPPAARAGSRAHPERSHCRLTRGLRCMIFSSRCGWGLRFWLPRGRLDVFFLERHRDKLLEKLPGRRVVKPDHAVEAGRG